MNGERLASIGYLQTGAGFMLVGLQGSLNIASSLLGFDVFNSVKNIISGGGTFWDYLDVGLTLAGPLAKAGKLAAKFRIGAGSRAFKWGREMVQNGMGRGRRIAEEAAEFICKVWCFAPGTLVMMADGSAVPIESIEPGNQVLCDLDPRLDNGPESGAVVRVFENRAPEVLDLYFASGDNYFSVTTTPDHPFYTGPGRGYVPASELRIGDLVTGLSCGQSVLVSISQRLDPTTTYNFEVAGAHNYYVTSADGCVALLVHNECIGHHTVPRQVLDKLNKRVRDHLNSLTGPDSIVWGIPEQLHIGDIHAGVGNGYRSSGGVLSPRGGAWNARWRAELHSLGKRLEDVGVDELLQIRDRIVRDFEIERYRPG